jgi:hypothetical protein
MKQSGKGSSAAYRNENNPLAIESNRLSSTDTDFGNAVGALQIEIDLEPGESRDDIFSLGIIPKAAFTDCITRG